MLTLLNVALVIVVVVLLVLNLRGRKDVSLQRSLFYKNRIDKANSLGKTKFILIEVLLKRFIPIMIILEIICSQMLRGGVNYTLDIVKLILACIIGFIVGSYQWNMLQKLSKGEYVETKLSALLYLLINGSLAWGVMIGIAYANYPAEPFYYAIVQVIFFGIIGLIYGLLDFMNHTKNLNSYKNYGKTRPKTKSKKK